MGKDSEGLVAYPHPIGSVRGSRKGSGLDYPARSPTGDLDYGFSIAVDTAGSAHVTGQTYLDGFPTVNAIQPTGKGFGEAFVSKFDPSGTNIAAGLGDYAFGLALDGNGNAYVTGYTFAQDFPLAGTPFQSSNAGNFDAFVAVINHGAGTPGGCTTGCLRVTAIDMRPTAGGVGARVTVRNESNAAVSGASVTVTWNVPGVGTSTQTRTTNLQGRATFSVSGGTGSYTITVVNISKSGSTFDPQNSTLLSKSITK